MSQRKMTEQQKAALFSEVSQGLSPLTSKRDVIIGAVATQVFELLEERGTEQWHGKRGIFGSRLRMHSYEMTADEGQTIPGYTNATLLRVRTEEVMKSDKKGTPQRDENNTAAFISATLRNETTGTPTDVHISTSGTVLIARGARQTQPHTAHVGDTSKLYGEYEEDFRRLAYHWQHVRAGQNGVVAAALVLRSTQAVTGMESRPLMDSLQDHYDKWAQVLKPEHGWEPPAGPDAPLWAQTIVAELTALRDVHTQG